jgi:hypothetical protein
MVGEI